MKINIIKRRNKPLKRITEVNLGEDYDPRDPYDPVTGDPYGKREDEKSDEKARKLLEPDPPLPHEPPDPLSKYPDVKWDSDGIPYHWDEEGNFVDLSHLMGVNESTKQQLRKIIKEEIMKFLNEDENALDPKKMACAREASADDAIDDGEHVYETNLNRRAKNPQK